MFLLNVRDFRFDFEFLIFAKDEAITAIARRFDDYYRLSTAGDGGKPPAIFIRQLHLSHFGRYYASRVVLRRNASRLALLF